MPFIVGIRLSSRKMFLSICLQGWIREVVVECILELLPHCPESVLTSKAFPELRELVGTSLEDMTASQLMLAIGADVIVYSTVHFWVFLFFVFANYG